jgi:predicted short-subunit dehydrogenase-like oxidoreductase (DUF2520 family)
MELAMEQLVASGISKREAREGLFNLAASALQAWHDHAGLTGLTGPVARGDLETISLHLGVLARSGPRSLYREIGLATLKLMGNQNPTSSRRIEAVLRRAQGPTL